MSSVNNVQKKAVASVEEAIDVVRAALGDTVTSIMIATSVVDGELSGVVLGEDEDYISGEELVDGVTYILVGLGRLKTSAEPGVTVVED